MLMKSKRFSLPLIWGLLLILLVASLGCTPTTAPEASVDTLAMLQADTASDVAENGRAIDTLITFDSGSNGSDGPLILDTPGTVDFFTLFPDADNIYHFTAITVSAGVTVDMSGVLQPAVHWLATDHVQIDGFIDLRGQPGHNAEGTLVNALPGAGGYMGGIGATINTSHSSGAGPGRGHFPGITNHSTGAGHASEGEGANSKNGKAYGNEFSIPLIGGSGGAGAIYFESTTGGGGGAGGGALLIASSSSLQINGLINVSGGKGGNTSGRDGGGGSGGTIRLIAPQIDGSGELYAHGGSSYYDGSHGRIRLEAFANNFTGDNYPPLKLGMPGRVFLPAEHTPIRITSIDGVPVPDSPIGGFNPTDLTINASGEIAIEIEAHGIPIGVAPVIELTTDSGTTIAATASPLVGTVLTSTATATMTIPSGFSQFTIQADWTP